MYTYAIFMYIYINIYNTPYTSYSDIYHRLPPAVAAAAACKNASSAFCSSPPRLRVNSLKRCVRVCAFRRPGCTQFYIIYDIIIIICIRGGEGMLFARTRAGGTRDNCLCALLRVEKHYYMDTNVGEREAAMEPGARDGRRREWVRDNSCVILLFSRWKTRQWPRCLPHSTSAYTHIRNNRVLIPFKLTVYIRCDTI